MRKHSRSGDNLRCLIVADKCQSWLLGLIQRRAASILIGTAMAMAGVLQARSATLGSTGRRMASWRAERVRHARPFHSNDASANFVDFMHFSRIGPK